MEMTALEFIALCGEHGVEVELALENEALKEVVMRGGDAEEVEQVLIEQF